MFAFNWDFHISTWEPLETESILLSGIFAFIWDFRLFHLWTVSKGIRGDRTGEQMSLSHKPSMDQKDFLQLFLEFFKSSPIVFKLFINKLSQFLCFSSISPPDVWKFPSKYIFTKFQREITQQKNFPHEQVVSERKQSLWEVFHLYLGAYA